MRILKFRIFENLNDSNVSDYFLEYIENGKCHRMGNNNYTIFACESDLNGLISSRLKNHNIKYFYTYHESGHIYGGKFPSIFVFLSDNLINYLNSFSFNVKLGYNDTRVEISDGISMKNLMKNLMSDFRIHPGIVTAMLLAYLRSTMGLEGKYFTI